MARGILALLLLAGCGADPAPAAPGTVVFFADPPELRLGEGAVLTWDAGEARGVQLLEEGWPIAEEEELPPSGSWRVQPGRTTRYQLRATGKGGAALEGSLMLTVLSGVHIASFQAEPRWVLPGQASRLRWSVRGVERITLLEGDEVIEAWAGAGAIEGAFAVRPGRTTTYTLIAEGRDGPVEAQATVVVDPPPRIELLASPRRLFVGDTAVLSWAFEDATSLRILEADGTEIHRSTEAIGFLAVQPEENTTYRALAVGHGGASEATVEVVVLPVIERFRLVGVEGVGKERRAILAWQTTGAHELLVSNLEGWEVSLSAGAEEGHVRAPVGEAGTFRLIARTRDGGTQEATLAIEGGG